MKQYRICRHLLLLGASSAAIATPAMAQIAPAGTQPPTASPQTAPATNSPSEISDIIVTANKREQNLQKVGLTITAVSGDQLKAEHVVSLADIANVVPGLTYTTTENATPVYTLRGVGFYERSLAAYPTTSVYLDEVALPFPVMTTHTAFDLQRVEVLKGPQGTLFGNNATGGAINFIAAKPTMDLTAGGDLTYGRFNTITGNAYVSGPLADNLQARIAVNFGDGDAWQYSYTRNDKNGKTDYRAARLLLDWQPTENLSFQFNANGWVDKSDPQAPQINAKTIRFAPPGNPFVTAEPFPPMDARAADWSPTHHPFGDDSLFQFALRSELKLSQDLTLTSITSYAKENQNQVQDLSGVDATLFTFGPNLGSIKSFAQELRLSNSAAGAFRWIVGGNYSADDVYENDVAYFDQASASFALGIKSTLEVATNKMRNYAGFANAEYDVVSDVTLKGGIRYTESDRTGSSCSSDPITGTTNLLFGVTPTQCFSFNLAGTAPSIVPFTQILNEHNVSWRAGIDWRVRPGVLVYGNISKGYKAGSIPAYPATSVKTLVAVKQESVLAYEAGIKTTLFDRMLTLNAAAFYYDYRNKQIKTKLFDSLFGGLDVLANIPKSSIKGAEVDATLRLVRGLEIKDSLGYTDAKLDQFTGYGADLVTISPVPINYDGTSIPFAPKWHNSVSADYSFPLKTRVSAFVGGTYTNQSSELAGVTKAGTSPVSANYVIPGYGTLDLHAGIEGEGGKWRVSIFGKNVTNKFYLVNVFSGNDTVLQITGMPATYGVTVGFKL